MNARLSTPNDRATYGGGGGDDRHAIAPHLERHVRAPWSLPVFASAVSLAFVLAAITDHSPAMALETMTPAPAQATQQFIATDDYVGSIEPIEWLTSRVFPTASALSASTPEAGEAMAIAFTMVTDLGWSATEYDCLVALWNKESRWNVYAENASSGAYGIPQALPGNKMASAGDDWQTNPATQITWGLGYIAARYETPCGAWAHSQRVGWY